MDALSEVDLLRLKLLISNRERLEAQYQAAMLANRQQERELHEHITKAYGLGDGDSVDTETGRITRKSKEPS